MTDANGKSPEVDGMIATADPALLDKWQIRTLAHAYLPRPPLRYIVETLFSEASLNIVYGAPGTLKSMLLADMCVCVAAGQQWLPPLPDSPGKGFATIQAPVLWIDLDNGIRRTDSRFDSLARARNLPETAPLSYVSMPRPWLDASKATNVDDVAELVTHMGAELVVIDNLGLVSGGKDENSGEMISVMSNLRQLAEDTLAAIVVVHHQRKANGFKTRAGDGLRGSSTIEASLDSSILVEREDHSQSGMVTVSPIKVREVQPAPFGALFSYLHKPDTTELETARFWLHILEDTKSDKAIDNAIDTVLDDSPSPLTKSKLVEQVKLYVPDAGINRISSRIDILAANSNILQSDGNRTTKLYRAVS